MNSKHSDEGSVLDADYTMEGEFLVMARYSSRDRLRLDIAKGYNQSQMGPKHCGLECLRVFSFLQLMVRSQSHKTGFSHEVLSDPFSHPTN